jgi:transcriptional regulator
MRVPRHFRSDDPDEAWRVIDAHGFATLVTTAGDGRPTASPLAFLARPDEGERGRLVSHLARDNAQLRHLHAGGPVLVIFTGPSAFVSASWYDDAPVVPTWNHVTVHVSGRPRVHDDHGACMEVLAATVGHFEARAGSSWRLPVDDPDIRAWARAVVPFHVDVDTIETALKLSQNVGPERRREVVAGMLAAGHGDVAAAMARASGLSLAGDGTETA